MTNLFSMNFSHGACRFIMVPIALCLFFVMAKGQAVATLEAQELLMGNLLKLTVSVPVENDSVKVSFPLLESAAAQKKKYVGLANDSVELLTVSTRTYVPSTGGNEMVYHLQIQAFDSGRYVLAPFEFIVGNRKVETNPVTLNVLPVKVKADDQPDPFSDIAQPFEEIPDPGLLEEEEAASLVWWLIVAAGLLLLALGIMFFKFRQTGKLPFIKSTPFYQQVLNKLEKLERQDLPSKGKTKEYYTRLTDIMRGYLNKQFGIRTFERTSAEIIADMQNDQELEQYSGTVNSIFETSDFVKFAKVTPSVVENQRCMSEARKFVEISHPEEQVEKKKGGVA